MRFSLLHPFKTELRVWYEHIWKDHVPAVVRMAPHSASEGSEFLDDALRMEDLMMTPTEECIAAGSPDRLL